MGKFKSQKAQSMGQLIWFLNQIEIIEHGNRSIASVERKKFCLKKMSSINHLYWTFFEIGGVRGTRTPDPLHAMQVLSQLSYNPKWCFLIIRGLCVSVNKVK